MPSMLYRIHHLLLLWWKWLTHISVKLTLQERTWCSHSSTIHIVGKCIGPTKALNTLKLCIVASIIIHSYPKVSLYAKRFSSPMLSLWFYPKLLSSLQLAAPARLSLRGRLEAMQQAWSEVVMMIALEATLPMTPTLGKPKSQQYQQCRRHSILNLIVAPSCQMDSINKYINK